MARFPRYVLAGLVYVVAPSSVSVAWAAPQNANPQQAAPPVQPSTPFEIPLDVQSSGTMLMPSQSCFTMRVAPADPNIDKGMAQRPLDRQTDFTMQIVPAPPCVVPGVTAAPGQRWELDTSPVLPTNRSLAPFNRIPDIRTIPVFPFPTLPLFAPVIPQATPGQDGTPPR